MPFFLFWIPSPLGEDDLAFAFVQWGRPHKQGRGRYGLATPCNCRFFLNWLGSRIEAFPWLFTIGPYNSHSLLFSKQLFPPCPGHENNSAWYGLCRLDRYRNGRSSRIWNSTFWRSSFGISNLLYNPHSSGYHWLKTGELIVTTPPRQLGELARWG